MTPEERAALEAENAQLKQRLADAEARAAGEQRVARQAAITAANSAFTEGLVGSGRLLPAEKSVAVAALDHFAAADTPVQFGEGDEQKPLADAFKTFLAGLPKRVEFGEVAGGKVTFPGGDADPEAIRAAALSYQEAQEKSGNPISYVLAVQHVCAQQGGK